MMLSNLKLNFIKHKDKIKTLAEIAKSIADYSLTKSKFSLVNGGLLGLETLLGLNSNDPSMLFNTTNGWSPITSYKPIHNLFTSTLNRLDGVKLPFDYDNAKLFKTQFGEFISIQERYNSHSEISIISKSENTKKILSFLGQEKLKELNSQYLELTEINIDDNNSQLILAPFTLHPITSTKSTQIIKDLTNCFSKNINRSMLLYGWAGTGKTTLAHTIVNKFGFRTLKMHPSKSITIPYFLELLDIFQIEALILDDFDQIEMNDKLLQFLEIVNDKLELVIGIANVLDGFDPAVLRPGRFDELIQINELDENTVVEILGDLANDYFEKVRLFPIAYIKELVKQNILNPDKLEEKYEELAERVDLMKQAYQEEEFEEFVEE